MSERDRGPRSDLARYAFGYSDKKPGMWFWLIHAAMVVYIIVSIVHVQ